MLNARPIVPVLVQQVAKVKWVAEIRFHAHYVSNRVLKSRAPGHCDDHILYDGAQYLWEPLYIFKICAHLN